MKEGARVSTIQKNIPNIFKVGGVYTPVYEGGSTSFNDTDEYTKYI